MLSFLDLARTLVFKTKLLIVTASVIVVEQKKEIKVLPKILLLGKWKYISTSLTGQKI